MCHAGQRLTYLSVYRAQHTVGPQHTVAAVISDEGGIWPLVQPHPEVQQELGRGAVLVTVTDCPVRFESGVRRTRSSVLPPRAHGPTQPPSAGLASPLHCGETQREQTPVVRPGVQRAEACARAQGTEPSWIPRGFLPPPPGSPPVTPAGEPLLGVIRCLPLVPRGVGVSRDWQRSRECLA